MRCVFCGKEFGEAETAGTCAGCPLHRTCNKAQCPHCGYEVVRTPRWLRWLTYRHKNQTGPCRQGAHTLASMKAGEHGVIVGLERADERTVRKLMAMGLVPGVELSVIRSKPGVVLRIGFGEMALDRETASMVTVNMTAGR